MTPAEFPKKLAILFQPSRYKVLYGGRGGAKSWGIARALLILGSQKPLRILCCRELQNSMADSVHKLLSDQIVAMGLESFYDIQKQYIHGKNGTQFSFEGLKHNVSRIKSYEGVDICWVEEAESTSRTSWNVLIPTIRKEGSEIWVSFNPKLREDDTFDRFVTHTPPNCLIERISWRDNPWFPQTLMQEMETLKAKNFDEYLNVWEGECVTNLNGAVYANEIRRTTEEGRICKVPYDGTVSVDVFADLGRQDSTTLLFVQRVGFEYHIIHHYSNNLEYWGHYLKYLQDRRYLYGTIFLPHDARAKTIGTKMSVEELTREASFKVRIVPKLSIADGINAARTIFDRCYFDEKECADFLQNLRRYHYETEPNQRGIISKDPVHDESSHDADAFRYFAVMSKPPKRKGLGNSEEFEDDLVVPSGLKALRQRVGILARSGTGWMR